MTLEPGDEFAGYRVLRRLGTGGMGSVYLVQHPRLPRHDALKVLDGALGQDPDYRARFEREAELAARLEHPNVVAIHDRGRAGDTLWITMQYVDGVDVDELIRRGPADLPPQRAVHILTEVARGLDAAHRRGLLHRDVKPANILVNTDDDGSDRVRITDFGIARAVDQTSGLTATGSVVATIAYAAPEQIAGTPLDHRVDVYALGGTLYTMLTGAAPFGTRPIVATMRAHLHERPPRPTSVAPGLPAALDEVIATAMAKDPAERYDSCAALAADAARALRSGTGPPPTITAPPPAATPPAGPKPGRGRRIASVGAALIVVLALVVGAVWWGMHDDDSATGSPTPTMIPATASTTDAGPSTTAGQPPNPAWGPAADIVAAFPGLLPADPNGTGYQGIRCSLTNPNWVHCPSDNGFSVNVRCDPNRNRVGLPTDTTGLADVRHTAWSRVSGSGEVRWSTDAMAGFGLLDVAFDDPARWFCTVGASGGSGGQDVYDNWFTGAPL